MKLITFERDGRMGYGAVVDGGGIVDLSARLGRDAPSLLELIAGGLTERARAIVAAEKPDFTLDAVKLERPIPAPGKILCIGVNYPDRNAEYKDGAAPSQFPNVFIRFPASFVAHGAPLVRPPETKVFDYEGEIALVIGKRGRRIPREQAMAHVLGYTAANEGTARDWTRHGRFNVTQGKNFDRSGSIGPCITTADAMPVGPIRIETRVNGNTRQSDSSDRLIYPFDYLISYVSIFTTLEPGDVMLTGTPIGTGGRLDPPVWLQPGDVVEVEVSGVGVLSNTVADE
jgi:2-keto-4-pentenoate hydratase/2-oxohepta-3-ene-1,7-dioic acid hydratase in catechol pathway